MRSKRGFGFVKSRKRTLSVVTILIQHHGSCDMELPRQLRHTPIFSQLSHPEITLGSILRINGIPFVLSRPRPVYENPKLRRLSNVGLQPHASLVGIQLTKLVHDLLNPRDGRDARCSDREQSTVEFHPVTARTCF